MSQRDGIDSPDPKPIMTRRRFVYLGFAAIVASAGLGYYAWQVEPHWIRVVRRSMPIAGLPVALEGARLVQLSDIHVGPMVDDAYVLDVFDQVAALNPDILVITGDLVSYYKGAFVHAEDIYSRLPSAPLGTIAILGNHDYGYGWQDLAVAQQLADIMSGLGVTVLRNEVTDVAGLQVIGMDDLWARTFDPEKALSQVDPAAPMLALSHNPDTVDLPGWDGFEGWVLSGHTHAGQIQAPIYGPVRPAVENTDYVQGEYELGGNRMMYIHPGVGHLQQVRFNARPEITVHELTRA